MATSWAGHHSRRGGPARIRAGPRSRAGNSSGSTEKYVAGGTLMQMLDRRRQCAGRREQQPRPEQRVRKSWTSQAVYRRSVRACPTKRLSVISPRSCSPSCVTSVTATRQFPAVATYSPHGLMAVVTALRAGAPGLSLLSAYEVRRMQARCHGPVPPASSPSSRRRADTACRWMSWFMTPRITSVLETAGSARRVAR